MSIFQPSKAVEGGGLLDDVDALIKEARVEIWDYNGKVAVPVPALKLTLAVDGIDEDQLQYFSLGKATDWQPNEDGTGIVAIGKATGIVRSSNAMIFITSLVNAGFPENKIPEGDTVTWLEGTKVHLSRVPAPKRGGVVKAPREDGRVFEDTVLTVSSIISFPWDKKGAKAPAGKPAAGKPATTKAPTPAPAAAEAGDDFDTRVSEVLMGIVAEHPEGLKKSTIPGLALKIVAKDADKNKVVTRIFQEDFLNLQNGWKYENGMVTLGE